MKKKQIKEVSGTNDHFLAVCNDGSVLGRGNNIQHKIGFEYMYHEYDKYYIIPKLQKYKITSAYAVLNHSFFITSEGQILSCGENNYGECFIKEDETLIYPIKETIITGYASFCIAGDCVSAAFIGCDPPPNMPNKPINYDISLTLPENPITQKLTLNMNNSLNKNSIQAQPLTSQLNTAKSINNLPNLSILANKNINNINALCLPIVPTANSNNNITKPNNCIIIKNDPISPRIVNNKPLTSTNSSIVKVNLNVNAQASNLKQIIEKLKKENESLKKRK